jgi:hypothetical protein
MPAGPGRAERPDRPYDTGHVRSENCPDRRVPDRSGIPGGRGNRRGARATGRELGFAIPQTLTFADGRIAEVRPFYWDTAAVADACAVSGS